MSSQCDAVMLIGFGGPTSPNEVRPFLDRVLKGRPVPRERYEEVVHHYEFLGGRSPYNELAMRQAMVLRETLKKSGFDVPIIVGLRNAPPFFDDAIRELVARGVRRAFGFVLAAHRCEASWDRYLNEVNAARERIAGAPEIEYPPPWHDHPLFIEAVADRVRAALMRLDAAQRGATELIFTAHSIPVSMAALAPYAAQLNESAGLVAEAVGYRNWTLAYQSRSGSPRDPWLEPDIEDVLRQLGGHSVIVMPIGFLCDHVEVLYDLDVEAARTARLAGARIERAATVGDHPKFIGMIAEMARARLAEPRFARTPEN